MQMPRGDGSGKAGSYQRRFAVSRARRMRAALVFEFCVLPSSLPAGRPRESQEPTALRDRPAISAPTAASAESRFATPPAPRAAPPGRIVSPAVPQCPLTAPAAAYRPRRDSDSSTGWSDHIRVGRFNHKANDARSQPHAFGLAVLQGR
jgi:hypothetical protein